VPVIDASKEISMSSIKTDYDAVRNKIVVNVTYTTTKSGDTIIEAGSSKVTAAQSVASFSVEGNTCNPTETWNANRKVTLATGVDYKVSFNLTPKDGAGTYDVYAIACDKCANAGTQVCSQVIKSQMIVPTPLACNYNSKCDLGENNANCPNDCPVNVCNNDGTCDAGETSACADCKESGYCSFASQLNLFKMDDSCVGGSIVVGAGLLLLYIIMTRLGNQPPRRGRRY
jgi:hypothetical protein